MVNTVQRVTRLRALAQEISQACPPELLFASDYLVKSGELATRSGSADDPRITQCYEYDVNTRKEQPIGK